ncbi:MAG: DUF4830 domain-containing protein [Clostridia bacterium]|nr:DUF4830 domain-containing protein [Clostridia bacterium]
MFVYSIKSKQIKLFLLIAFVVVTVISLFILSQESTDVDNADKASIKASTASERLSFISQFGWEVDEDPVEVCEVIIPTEFDETYIQYNEIQLKQGFDLQTYSGMRVKRWTYSVKNYPGHENKNYIRINLLVYEGLVIGGDVCSIELDGFMHGFEKT